jgi:hypothetical protein
MLDIRERLVVAPSARFVPADTAVTALLAPKPHAAAADPSIDHRLGPAVAWQPASNAHIHAVESAVLLGVMGYFAYGLAAAFGLF